MNSLSPLHPPVKPLTLVRDDPFSLIPDWVLAARPSSKAIHIYALLARYADPHYGHAYPSRKALAEATHLSLDSIDRAVKELVRIKAIEVEKRTTLSGQTRANTYTIRRQIPEGVIYEPSTKRRGGRKIRHLGAAKTVHRKRTIEKENHSSLRSEEEEVPLEHLYAASSRPAGTLSPLKTPGPYLRDLRKKGDLPATADLPIWRQAIDIVVQAAQEGFLPPRELPMLTLPRPPDLVGLSGVWRALEMTPIRGALLRRRLVGFCREVLGEEHDPATLLTVLARHPEELVQFFSHSSISSFVSSATDHAGSDS